MSETLTVSNGFQLFRNRHEIEPLFAKWFDALREASNRDKARHWWSIEFGLGIERKPAGVISLFVDRHSSDRVVSLAIPNFPEGHDGLTGIGLDPSNRPWLFRQGTLIDNNVSDYVGPVDFLSGSGERPRFETRRGAADPRYWYCVARLDEPSEAIVEQTACFAYACAQARTFRRSDRQTPSLIGAPPVRIVSEAISADETTGVHDIAPLPGRTVRLRHAQVVNALGKLAMRARARSGSYAPRHGLQPDIFIEANGENLLVEVKTSASANDVQTAIGQLFVYRRVFCELENHAPVLLVPEGMTSGLAAAVSDLGISVAVFRWSGERFGEGRLEVTSPALAACGIGSS